MKTIHFILESFYDNRPRFVDIFTFPGLEPIEAWIRMPPSAFVWILFENSALISDRNVVTTSLSISFLISKMFVHIGQKENIFPLFVLQITTFVAYPFVIDLE